MPSSLITKVKCILSSNSRDMDFWSVDHTYEMYVDHTYEMYLSKYDLLAKYLVAGQTTYLVRQDP